MSPGLPGSRDDVSLRCPNAARARAACRRESAGGGVAGEHGGRREDGEQQQRLAAQQPAERVRGRLRRGDLRRRPHVERGQRAPAVQRTGQREQAQQRALAVTSRP